SVRDRVPDDDRNQRYGGYDRQRERDVGQAWALAPSTRAPADEAGGHGARACARPGAPPPGRGDQPTRPAATASGSVNPAQKTATDTSATAPSTTPVTAPPPGTTKANTSAATT